MYIKFLFLFSFIVASQIQGVEIRASIPDCSQARENLTNQQAVYLGDYAFKDHIYSNHESENLNDEFFRIREYELTRWKQKSVVAVHKVRNPQAECYAILFEEEHDTLAQAQENVPENFSKKCSFFRAGWEYRLDNMRIFVEEIEGLLPSIEVIAKSQVEILALFNEIGIISVLSDSVPEWYCNQGKINVDESVRESIFFP